jgi:hypothetical protein
MKISKRIGKQSEERENFQTGSETIRRNKKFPKGLENIRAKLKLLQTDWKTLG